MGTKTIWDGEDLPPVGCEVLIQLGSEEKKPHQGWVRHLVSGYKIHQAHLSKGATAIDKKYHRRVDIKVEAHPDERSSFKNCRNLADVRPVDWRPS